MDIAKWTNLNFIDRFSVEIYIIIHFIIKNNVTFISEN